MIPGRTLSPRSPRQAVPGLLVRAGPGTCDAHLAGEDVPKPAVLVDLEPVQDLPNLGHTRVNPNDYMWAVADDLLPVLAVPLFDSK